MENQLSIGNFNNCCHYLGKQEDAFLVNNEIRRLLKKRVPGLLATGIDTHLDSFLAEQRVYRIRQLKFNLCITRTNMDLGHLSEQLVENLIASLQQQLSSSQTGIKSYQDSADFHAAFICDLLDGRAWSQWEYDEFKHLQHVDDNEAVIQVLLPQRKNLPKLLNHLRKRIDIKRLFSQLNKEQLFRLYQHWFAGEPTLHFNSSLLTDRSRLQLFATIAELQNTNKDQHEADFTAEVLYQFFQLLLIRPEQNFSKLLSELSTFQFIKKYAREILKYVDDDNKRGRAKKFIQQNLDDYLQDITQHFIHWLQEDRNNRMIVTLLLIDLSESMDGYSELHKKATVKQNVNNDANLDIQQSFYSENAGLALLIPVVMSLGLYRQCSPTFLRTAILLALCEDDAQQFAESAQRSITKSHKIAYGTDKPGAEINRIDDLDWLSKVFPSAGVEQLTDFKLPKTWRFGLSENKQATILNCQGVEQCYRLILAQFASRMTGMSESSAHYLRVNFLQRPGSIKFFDSTIVVRLEPIPLRIVLDLAGYSSWTETLAWSETRLSIEVRS